MDLMLFGLPVAALIVGLVGLAKQVGLSSRWAALLAVLLGIGFGVLARLAQDPAIAAWLEPILLGLLTGLAAAGLYSSVKTQREG